MSRQRNASVPDDAPDSIRENRMTPRLLDLNATLAGLEHCLRRLIGEHIELVMKLDPSIPPVVADAEPIEQVVLNLALDACEGMTHGGVLLIETAEAPLDDTHAPSQHNAAPTHAVLSITDTGSGMSGSMLLGLVRRSGGHCRLRRQPGQATQFSVYLPTVNADIRTPGKRTSLPPGLERRSVA